MSAWHYPNPHPWPRLVLDCGPDSATVLIAGMGRTGTTWLAELLNHAHPHRLIFEPFFPGRVAAASAFRYLEYVPPECREPLRTRQARRILAGRVHNDWVDTRGSWRVWRRRLVKAIRGNLMLGWLRTLRPDMPIILLTRHPWDVARSWSRLGWIESEPDGSGGDDLELLLQQPDLLRDYPVISDALEELPPRNPFERVVLTWCILYHVPLHQPQAATFTRVRYEELLAQPREALGRVFAACNLPLDWERLSAVLSRRSFTSLENAAPPAVETNEATVRQPPDPVWLQATLERFGLASLYPPAGG